MTLWTHYHMPATVDEALELLDSYRGRARIVAGGTDLLLDIRRGHTPPPEALIDITGIDGMDAIQAEGDTVFVGAGATHAQIVRSALLAGRATCLVESCGVVGGPQVRNVGTLGGNVAHALPAGDGTTSLVALDAAAEAVIDGERRWWPVADLFLGPGQSRLDSTRDLLLRFRFRGCRPREATAFKRLMRPQGVALPILGCAAWIRLDDAGAHYEEVRVCVGPVAGVPTRAIEIETALRGQPVGAAALDRAINAASAHLRPRASRYRATGDYRREMIAVLLRRVLPLAVTRARTGRAAPEGIGE